MCKVRVNKLPEHLQSHTKQQIVNALLRSEQSNAVQSLQSGVNSLHGTSRGVLGRNTSGGGLSSGASRVLPSGASGVLLSGASGGQRSDEQSGGQSNVAGPSFISSNKRKKAFNSINVLDLDKC